MRLLLVACVLLAGCGNCGFGVSPDGGSDGVFDAGGAADASGPDASAADSGCLLECAPPDWTDGGFAPVGVLKSLGLPTYCFFEARISASGAVLSRFGFSDGGCSRAIAFADGRVLELSDSAEQLLLDDSWIDCPGFGECVRTQLDGGRVARFGMQHVIAATCSGWVAGDDIGTATDTGLVLGPDGGRWACPVSCGVGAFNEKGFGVGQFRSNARIKLWRNGIVSTLPLLPPATADWGADINDHGMIGGVRHIAGRNRAAVFWDEEVVDLPLRRGDSSQVIAVNDNNLAVGVEWDSESPGVEHGFVWGKGQYYLLDELIPDAGCTVVRAMDINNANQIAARVRCVGIERPSMVRIDLAE